jgi:hypothetical protein
MDFDISYLKKHDIHLIKIKGRLDSYYASQLEDSHVQETAKRVLRTSKTLDLFCHTNDPKEAVRLFEGKKGSPLR